jgi:hypothetical protein
MRRAGLEEAWIARACRHEDKVAAQGTLSPSPLSPEKLIFSRAASLDVSYVMDPAYQRLEQLVSKRRYPRLNAVALDVLAMV